MKVIRSGKIIEIQDLDKKKYDILVDYLIKVRSGPVREYPKEELRDKIVYYTNFNFPETHGRLTFICDKGEEFGSLIMNIDGLSSSKVEKVKSHLVKMIQ